jgi:hypothetical protein
MSAAVNDNGAIAIPNQCWDLISPIPAVAEAAVQKYHGWTKPIVGVPDSRAVMIDMSLISKIWQRRGTFRFKFAEIVVVVFHCYSLHEFI